MYMPLILYFHPEAETKFQLFQWDRLIQILYDTCLQSNNTKPAPGLEALKCDQTWFKAKRDCFKGQPRTRPFWLCSYRIRSIKWPVLSKSRSAKGPRAQGNYLNAGLTLHSWPFAPHNGLSHYLYKTGILSKWSLYTRLSFRQEEFQSLNICRVF